MPYERNANQDNPRCSSKSPKSASTTMLTSNRPRTTRGPRFRAKWNTAAIINMLPTNTLYMPARNAAPYALDWFNAAVNVGPPTNVQKRYGLGFSQLAIDARHRPFHPIDCAPSKFVVACVLRGDMSRRHCL